MIREAFFYRAGSIVLSTVLLGVMSGDWWFSAGASPVLLVVHTGYYIAFRQVWRWYHARR